MRTRSLALIGCSALMASAISACSTRAAEQLTQAPSESSASAAAPSVPAARPPGRPGWQNAGTSLQGRSLRVLTVGSGARRVLFIGGIHGDESEGAYATEQLPGAFTDAGLADAVTLTILEDANPDGRVAGTRGNAAGVDLNRNFPATNFDSSNAAGGGKPLSQPESRAVADLIDRVRPDLIMVMHSWRDREFINFDGPARALAERFSAASGIPVTSSNEFPVTPGSLGSFAGRDRGVALLTVELLKGSDPVAEWNRIRTAVLQALRGV